MPRPLSQLAGRIESAISRVAETHPRTGFLTHITRRDVAPLFGDDLAGERGVERYFPLSTPIEDFFGSSGRSLRDQIAQHMDRNPGDWTVEHLFGEIGAFDCSRARFGALLEEAKSSSVSPCEPTKPIKASQP
jgi:AbiJ N-terminal domain 3